MNYENIKKFLVVAKNLNISNSANELFISQPALSKTIKEIEKELDHKLFIRKSKGLMLTEAGQQLYDKLRKPFNEIDEIIERFTSTSNDEFIKIRIGTSLTIAKKFLTFKLSKYMQKYPNIKIELKSLKVSDCITELKDKKIDFFLTNTDISADNDFVIYKLKDLHDCLIGGSVFKHLKSEKLNFKDLKYYPLITNTKKSVTRNSFNNFCNSFDITLNPTIEVENNGFLSELVKLNMGIGYTTYEFIQDEIDNKTLFQIETIQQLPTRKLYLVTNTNNNLPSFDVLLNILLDD
ncbi:MAG: LysR family transcriptional regulator [Clostridia bacterium]|nr:LysR family transcriptional regulator [Clostridia bacterium]